MAELSATIRIDCFFLDSPIARRCRLSSPIGKRREEVLERLKVVFPDRNPKQLGLEDPKM